MMSILFLRRYNFVVGLILSLTLSLSFLVDFSWSLSSSSSSSITSRPLPSVATTTSSDTNDCRHYKWLIVGGGIHGVGIAARLIGAGKISNDNSKQELLLVDEHPTPLYSWKERTRATGMTFLRSSAGFHLDVPAQGLRRFAADKGRGEQQDNPTTMIATATVTATTTTATKTKKPSKKSMRKAKNNKNKSNHSNDLIGRDYQRPALELFNDHCDLVVDKYRLDDFFFRGRVESIDCVNNDNDGHDNNKAGPARVVIRTAPDSDDSTTMATMTTVTADNIVLAVGNDDPLYPEWATDLLSMTSTTDAAADIRHLLEISAHEDKKKDTADKKKNSNNNDDAYDTYDNNNGRVVAIIGGGISAVHKALQLTSSADSNSSSNSNDNADVVVHIISRHPLREQQFDTHQDWMMTQEYAQRSLENGGKGLTERQKVFETLDTPAKRRAVIGQERIPGTVPNYMTRAKGGLADAIREGKIQWHVAGVASAAIDDDDDDDGDDGDDDTMYTLNLTTGDSIAVDRIILATGLGKRPPGHQIIHPLAAQADLPLSPCGYPIVDKSLRWRSTSTSTTTASSSHRHDHDHDHDHTSSNIFVSGGLAELELGPSARNIAGARMAAERIAAAAIAR